jgi:gas vesicle protein
MSEKSDFGSFLVGFLVGGITGAAVALLLTPQSGEETRTVIKEKAIELKDKAVDTYGEVSEKVGVTAADYKVKADELVQEAKVKADDLTKQGQVILEEQKTKVTEIAKKARKAESKPVEPPAVESEE